MTGPRLTKPLSADRGLQLLQPPTPHTHTPLYPQAPCSPAKLHAVVYCCCFNRRPPLGTSAAPEPALPAAAPSRLQFQGPVPPYRPVLTRTRAPYRPVPQLLHCSRTAPPTSCVLQSCWCFGPAACCYSLGSAWSQEPSRHTPAALARVLAVLRVKSCAATHGAHMPCSGVLPCLVVRVVRCLQCNCRLHHRLTTGWAEQGRRSRALRHVSIGRQAGEPCGQGTGRQGQRIGYGLLCWRCKAGNRHGIHTPGQQHHTWLAHQPADPQHGHARASGSGKASNVQVCSGPAQQQRLSSTCASVPHAN